MEAPRRGGGNWGSCGGGGGGGAGGPYQRHGASAVGGEGGQARERVRLRPSRRLAPTIDKRHRRGGGGVGATCRRISIRTTLCLGFRLNPKS